MSSNKNIKCTRCKKYKPADFKYFKPNEHKLNGFHSWCRKCESEHAGSYKYNHNFPPKMEGEKMCSKCKTIHPITFFSPCKSVKDGRTSWCRTCCNKKNKEYGFYPPKDGINSNYKYKAKYPEKWAKYNREYQRQWTNDPLNKIRRKVSRNICYHVKNGNIVKPTTCQKCGKTDCKTYSVVSNNDLMKLNGVATNQHIMKYVKFYCSKCNIKKRDTNESK